MKLITEVKNFEGKKVFVRVDWNVPFDKEKNEPSDTSRIEVSLPTIEYIKKHNGIPLVASHFGREGDSIMSVVDFAKRNFAVLSEGVEFLENLRVDKREEENNFEFAKELAGKADYYVNDAFSVSHREHASVVGVPKFLPHFAGLRFLDEVKNLSRAFEPEHPFLFILGGAKIETKIPLIERFLELADSIFIGGKLAAEAESLEIAKNPKIFFPHGDIEALDVDQETIESLKSKVASSKFILWNGPVGKYEDGYDWGTKEIAKLVASTSKNGAVTIVGGGDTEAAITELDIEDQFTWVSLAGGAMLDFLAKGALPGIIALDS